MDQYTMGVGWLGMLQDISGEYSGEYDGVDQWRMVLSEIMKQNVVRYGQPQECEQEPTDEDLTNDQYLDRIGL